MALVYLPLWFGVAYATESITSPLLWAIVSIAACAATFWAVRKGIAPPQYTALRAGLMILLVALVVLTTIGNSSFGRQHAQDLIAVAVIFVAALGIAFWKLGHVVRLLMSPVMLVLHYLLLATIAIPLVAGTARLTLSPVLPRKAEVLLAHAQFPNGLGIHKLYKNQCSAFVTMPRNDIITGKPLPQDPRPVPCATVRPIWAAVDCLVVEKSPNAHSSVVGLCRDWQAQVESRKSS